MKKISIAVFTLIVLAGAVAADCEPIYSLPTPLSTDWHALTAERDSLLGNIQWRWMSYWRPDWDNSLAGEPTLASRRFNCKEREEIKIGVGLPSDICRWHYWDDFVPYNLYDQFFPSGSSESIAVKSLIPNSPYPEKPFEYSKVCCTNYAQVQAAMMEAFYNYISKFEDPAAQERWANQAQEDCIVPIMENHLYCIDKQNGGDYYFWKNSEKIHYTWSRCFDRIVDHEFFEAYEDPKIAQRELALYREQVPYGYLPEEMRIGGEDANGNGISDFLELLGLDHSEPLPDEMPEEEEPECVTGTVQECMVVDPDGCRMNQICLDGEWGECFTADPACVRRGCNPGEVSACSPDPTTLCAYQQSCGHDRTFLPCEQVNPNCGKSACTLGETLACPPDLFGCASTKTCVPDGGTTKWSPCESDNPDCSGIACTEGDTIACNRNEDGCEMEQACEVRPDGTYRYGGCHLVNPDCPDDEGSLSPFDQYVRDFASARMAKQLVLLDRKSLSEKNIEALNHEALQDTFMERAKFISLPNFADEWYDRTTMRYSTTLLMTATSLATCGSVNSVTLAAIGAGVRAYVAVTSPARIIQGIGGTWDTLTGGYSQKSWLEIGFDSLSFLEILPFYQGGSTIVRSYRQSGSIVTSASAGTKAFLLGTCFLPGTKIRTAEGEKNIEDIAIGDMAYSYSEKTGAIELRPVIQTKVRTAEAYLQVHYDGDKALNVTPEHRFYDGSSYKAIAEFSAGDTLYLMDGDELQPVSIDSIKTITENATVYNFAVADNHNYFAGDVLVHNAYDSNQLTIPGAELQHKMLTDKIPKSPGAPLGLPVGKPGQLITAKPIRQSAPTTQGPLLLPAPKNSKPLTIPKIKPPKPVSVTPETQITKEIPMVENPRLDRAYKRLEFSRKMDRAEKESNKLIWRPKPPKPRPEPPKMVKRDTQFRDRDTPLRDRLEGRSR